MLCHVKNIPLAHGVTWLEGSKAVKGSDGGLVKSIKLEVALGSVNKHIFLFFFLEMVFLVCNFREVQMCTGIDVCGEREVKASVRIGVWINGFVGWNVSLEDEVGCCS